MMVVRRMIVHPFRTRRKNGLGSDDVQVAKSKADG
jgi:hypothetical protein